jgi:hypothetical protein
MTGIEIRHARRCRRLSPLSGAVGQTNAAMTAVLASRRPGRQAGPGFRGEPLLVGGGVGQLQHGFPEQP